MSPLKKLAEFRRHDVPDERVRAITHRAGYIAFGWGCGLFWLVAAIELFALDDDVAGAMTIFAGLMTGVVFLIVAARGGVFATGRDEINRTIERRRRTTLGLIVGGMVFALWMFAFGFWIESKPLTEALLSALIATSLFIGIQALIYLRRPRER